jgi:hypothetical protein
MPVKRHDIVAEVLVDSDDPITGLVDAILKNSVVGRTRDDIECVMTADDEEGIQLTIYILWKEGTWTKTDAKKMAS